MHGGATHFSIALLLVSVLFDHSGFWWREEQRRREFRAFGFYSLLIAAAASPAAVISGIALSKGILLGTGVLILSLATLASRCANALERKSFIASKAGPSR